MPPNFWGGGGVLYNPDKNNSQTRINSGNPPIEQTENLSENEGEFVSVFDPENDPVLFTTNSGIKIRFHNENEPLITTKTPAGDISKKKTSGGLKGYPYITTYSDEDGDGVLEAYNWVIIGYSQETYTGPASVDKTNGKKQDPIYVEEVNSGFIEFLQNMDTTSPAGRAIAQDGGIFNSFGHFNYDLGDMTYNPQELFGDPTEENYVGPKPGPTTDLQFGQVLCLSEKILGNSPFYSGPTREDPCAYTGSDLQIYMENIYANKQFGLNQILTKIVSQDLKTADYLHGGKSYLNVPCVETYNQHLFPLAIASYWKYNDGIYEMHKMPDSYVEYYKQQFIMENYFDRTSWYWDSANVYGYAVYDQLTTWVQGYCNFRSSYYNSSNNNFCMGWGSGNVLTYHNCTENGQVRPAFVLSLL